MVAIIVPVFRRFEISRRLFDSLCFLHDVLVIVIDDGDQAEYRNYCDENQFVYIRGTGDLYWGGMINLGLDYLRTNQIENLKRVIFANDDIIIKRDSFYKLVSLDLDIVHPVVLGENECAVESGAKLINRNLTFTRHPFRGLHKDSLPENTLQEIDIFTGRFLVMKPKVIDLLHGIRTNYFQHYGGDSDFGLRSRRYFRAYVYSGSVVNLNTRTTSNSLKLDTNWIGFTRSLFEFKSALNLKVKVNIILLNFPMFYVPLNLALLLPHAYAQYIYFKWKR